MLISWLSARQYAPEGGFAGRTNKLVDGCYSHWLGGCWPLLEAALNGPQDISQGLRPLTGSLYSREALIRYILTCCQTDSGGLKDKPSKSVYQSVGNVKVNRLTLLDGLMLTTPVTHLPGSAPLSITIILPASPIWERHLDLTQPCNGQRRKPFLKSPVTVRNKSSSHRTWSWQSTLYMPFPMRQLRDVTSGLVNEQHFDSWREPRSVSEPG